MSNTALDVLGQDRRIHTRAPCRVNVRELRPRSRTDGRALNLSEGGLYLQRLVGDLPEPGERLELELLLPGEAPLRVFGRVIAPRNEVFYPAGAVAFTHLSGHAALRIRRFVHSRGRRPVAGVPIGRVALVPMVQLSNPFEVVEV
jgi:hypothetical protein